MENSIFRYLTIIICNKKTMKKITPFLISLFTSASMPSFAQLPRLEIGDKPDEKSVSLQSMDVHVDIFGNLAKTVTTLVFKNNSHRNLEGTLLFPLPENTSVSGYAIDIQGQLRKAVPIAKARAVEVFESIQKQNIDPGIIEKVEGNNFRTRVSPIPANGTRTVQVSYIQQMKINKDVYQYHFALDNEAIIEKFNLQIKVFNAAQKPQLIESPDGSFNFSENSNVFEANLAKQDFKPSHSLTINLPKTEKTIESFIQKNTDGSAYFYANSLLNIPLKTKTWSSHIGIIWDNSLSGIKRDHAKELDLLAKIIGEKQNLTIEVAFLNIKFEKGKSFAIKNGDWSDLKKYLENIVYNGGTDYSKINSNNLNADEYLFFSDGISSFGNSQFVMNKPVYTIASTPTSNFNLLKFIAQKTNAKFINLNETSVDKAFEQINTQGLQFLGIKNNTDISEMYPMTGTEVQKDFSVSGIAQNPSEKITLLFGHNGKVELEKEINLAKASPVMEISKVWAQQKVDFLELNSEDNKTDIETIGKEFGLVTSNTSLIVLENVSDYVKYTIQPPAELADEYNRLIKQNFAQRENRKSDLLKQAITRAKELKKWWDTDFKPVKKKYPTPTDNTITAATSHPVALQGRTSEIYADAASNVRMEEVVVTGYGHVRHERSVAGSVAIADNKDKKEKADKAPVPEIKIAQIKSDKDYIKVLEASKKPFQTYLDLRPAYENTPSFYFDVATYYFQKNQKDTGLLILSSIADLGLENFELYKMLAYKLKEIKEFPSELFITKKVLDWRPFDAQSHRDFALALEDNGRSQEALDNLYKVLTNDYAVEIAMRDRDITEIIVPEINNIVALHRKDLDLSKINKDILIDIPVDIRVVMNWNKDMTDIDLWVTDPNNEKCYYGHRQTAIGGRNSEDVTQGFGPEQFMLKKAIKGKYSIQTNFFAERQMSITGPTTISVEIYLFYSSGKQTRKILTFQNNNANAGKDGILVGEFTF